MLARLAFVLSVLLLGLAGRSQAACSVGKDCVKQNNLPWCYTTGLDCQQQPSGSECALYPDHDGFLTRIEQLTWVADSQTGCPGRTAPTWVGEATEAEETLGSSAGGGPSTRTQEWSIWYTSGGSPAYFIYNSVGIRGSHCPAGFKQVFGGGCERVRVPSCQANPCTDYPVLPFSQEKRLSAVDLQGSNGLVLDRRYNSQSTFPTGSSDYLAAQPDPLPFGPKWISKWNVRLVIDGTRVRAARSTGNHYDFNFDGTAWLARTGEVAALTEVAPDPGSLVAWRLVERDDSVEEYSADGALLSIRQRDGRQYDLDYDANGRLQAVVDWQGRTIAFVWADVGAFPRIVRAELSDGGFAEYEYDTEVGRLDRVYGPEGLRATYLYNEAGLSAFTGTDRHYLITGIEDPDGTRYSTYRYDSIGRVTESGLAQGAGKHTFTIATKYESPRVL